MSSPVLVAAQCAVQAGDLVANLALHLDFMRRAGELGARLIIFPELSLSGYEPALAGALAQPAGSPLLEPLCSLAMTAGMTAVVGLPLRVPGRDKPQIAACILHPDGSRTIYTKQHLHAGEEQFFNAGQGGELLLVEGTSVALSVCADFAHAEHPAEAAERGAQVYAASVLIGEGGYPHDSSLLQGVTVWRCWWPIMAALRAAGLRQDAVHSGMSRDVASPRRWEWATVSWWCPGICMAGRHATLRYRPERQA